MVLLWPRQKEHRLFVLILDLCCTFRGVTVTTSHKSQVEGVQVIQEVTTTQPTVKLCVERECDGEEARPALIIDYRWWIFKNHALFFAMGFNNASIVFDFSFRIGAPGGFYQHTRAPFGARVC